MDEKRKELAGAVETQLRHAITAFYHEVSQTFAPLESFCQAETQRHLPLQERATEIEKSLLAVKSQLG
jgi:hypothetical protein